MRAAVNGSTSIALSTSAHLDAVAIGYERTSFAHCARLGDSHFGLRNSNARVLWSEPKRQCGHGTPAYQRAECDSGLGAPP